MATAITLPKLGLTMKEGTLEEWLASPGQQVAVGDPLLRLSTDKVEAEIEAEAAGVFHPTAEIGTTVIPGERIGWLLDGDETPPDSEGPTSVTPQQGDDGAQDRSETQHPIRAGDEQEIDARFRASPNARRIARERGVDVTALTGTGPMGRVVSEDVEDALDNKPAESAAAASAAAGSTAAGSAAQTATAAASRPPSPLARKKAAAAARADTAREDTLREDTAGKTATGEDATGEDADREDAAGEAEEIIPLKGIRGVIASRMHTSLQEMAQLTHGYEVRIGAAGEVRDQLKEELSRAGLPTPSITDFIVRAAALALREHRILNAVVEDEVIRLYRNINIGLAVDTDRGLMLPVITDAADRGLLGIASEARRLAAACREGTVAPDEQAGATFSVSSLGTRGVDMFTPIVAPGTVAILGVGRIRDGVEWDGDSPRRAPVLTLSLSFDHRAVDGAPAADFLRTVDHHLQSPLRLLAG